MTITAVKVCALCKKEYFGVWCKRCEWAALKIC